MYFDRPVYLWLLVLLPLLWFFLSRYVSTGDRVRKMWAKPSLSALLTPHRRDFLAALLVVVGFISLAVALADPYLLRITENPQFRRKNLVFLLDASPSMNTQDVWPSRSSTDSFRGRPKWFVLVWFPFRNQVSSSPI